MESLISLIKEEYGNLTKNEQVVADYILANPLATIEMSLEELASATYSSNSNISRFAKKIKLNNFKELAVYLAKDVGFISRHMAEGKEKGSNMINNVVDESIMMLFELRTMIKEREIDAIVDLIHNTERIDFFGRGVSNLVAQDCHQKFLKVKRVTNSYLDASMQKTGASTLTNKDTAIFFSYSGNQREIVESMKIAKICGAKVILVTKYNGSSSSESNADFTIYLPTSKASDDKLYYASSRLAMLQVVDLLYISYINKYSDSLKYLSKIESLK